MNQTKYEQAVKLQKDIKQLENHLELLEKADGNALCVGRADDDYGNSVVFLITGCHADCLPMPLPEFLEIYKSKVNEKIKLLKWEFSKL